MDSTVVKLINTENYDEYEFSMPQTDLADYFITIGAYSDYIEGNYILESLTGDFDFLEYDAHTDINMLNDLILEFESLRPQEQEKVLLLTNLYDNTVEAFHYAMHSYPKYTLLPNSLSSQEDVIEYIINEVYQTPLLKHFAEAIDYDLFWHILFTRDLAIVLNKRILIKHLELGV